MQTAHREAERLLEKIRARLPNDIVIANACDALSVLCRGYMEPKAASDLAGVHFTDKEARIFGLLHSRVGMSVSRTGIFDAMYFDSGGDEPDIKIVDVFVTRIRAKLESADAPYWIETDFGRGWKMHPEKLPAGLKKRDRYASRNRYFRRAAA